jgi:uncharacterized protein (DUF2062 family)
VADSNFDRAKRHAQTRRAKRMLRYAPRRAVFHRYPLIGRFAVLARRRAYLWSFKPKHVRPALYFGTILSLWPVMGVQLPLALMVALFVRCNFMVTGGLQFITNPLTAAPIYYGTYHVGRYVLGLTGFITEKSGAAAPTTGNVTISIDGAGPLTGNAEWGSAFGSVITALFVGGTLCGLVLAAALDLLYTLGWKLERRPRAAR